ncbi:hypothetical protein TKK_0017769 [Trichogramma kaykai]|uniref:G-protein coupled receptors family 1 profile domain-containing protein n=1 Tax=Trichogramma kaykai TaxID=54128 RepID=A0ABD2W306_9HYME
MNDSISVGGGDNDDDELLLLYGNLSDYDCRSIVEANALGSYQPLAYVMYSVIFVLALFGNALVCYVVCCASHMRNVTNYFIVNLAIADILIALFCIPTSFVSTLTLQYWPFGPHLCPVVNYLQAVAVLVSAYTLVAISVDRFVAIVWPLKPRLSKSHALQFILAIWVLALCISLPIVLVSGLKAPSEHYEYCKLAMCMENWEDPKRRFHYSTMMLILQYAFPLGILVHSYSVIAIFVWGNKPPGEAENNRDERFARSKKKMIKMMVLVVIVFTICWLPYNILVLLLDREENGIDTWEGTPYLWACLHWLAMSHACYNPVIYCWLNSRFRSSFFVVLKQLPIIRLRIRDRDNVNYTSAAGGQGNPNQCGLRRVNTCTTYIRTFNNNNVTQPARSASFRCNNESIRITSISVQRQHAHLGTQAEEPV